MWVLRKEVQVRHQRLGPGPRVDLTVKTVDVLLREGHAAAPDVEHEGRQPVAGRVVRLEVSRFGGPVARCQDPDPVGELMVSPHLEPADRQSLVSGPHSPGHADSIAKAPLIHQVHVEAIRVRVDPGEEHVVGRRHQLAAIVRLDRDDAAVVVRLPDVLNNCTAGAPPPRGGHQGVPLGDPLDWDGAGRRLDHRPADDTLIRVAHDAEVPVRLGEPAHDAVLRAVRVLVLVDEDVAPAVAVEVEHGGARLEEAHHEQEQVVEVHRARRRAAHLVQAVERGDPLLRGRPRLALDVLHREHLVLGVADPVHGGGGRERALVEAQLAHGLLHEREAVVLVVDDEARRQPHVRRVLAQDPHAGGVEGGDERRADAHGQHERLHARAHLLGSLVGERHREHVARIHALDGEKVGDAMGDHARLAAARAGEDEERPRGGRHRLTLDGVERVEDGATQDVPGPTWAHTIAQRARAPPAPRRGPGAPPTRR